MNEEEYKKELAENGVDIPEIVDEPKEEALKEEAKVEETPKEEEPKPDAPKEDLPEPREKRSIYDDYKEVKADKKSAIERAEQAERERDALQEKLDAIGNAPTPEKKQEAQDKFDEFAEKINADPQVIREMRELFVSDIKPTSSLTDADRTLLEEARAAKEEKMFEQEFKTVTPTLKEFFPTVTEEEMEAIKKELDDISHTKEWADKSLDYIAFKQKDKLAALVSPKRRGIEPKNPKDVPQGDTDFDPSADLSKMSYEQREKWYEKYQNLGKSEGLETDGNGRKILI